jgi:hypothetical protein
VTERARTARARRLDHAELALSAGRQRLPADGGPDLLQDPLVQLAGTAQQVSLSVIRGHSTTITLGSRDAKDGTAAGVTTSTTVNDLPEGSGQSDDSQEHDGSFRNG